MYTHITEGEHECCKEKNLNNNVAKDRIKYKTYKIVFLIYSPQ